MSAIAGIYHYNRGPVQEEYSRCMMDALSPFPADDIRVWTQEGIFLGCLAQWITPESVGEPLPYYDSERKLAITADAIIDNRSELFEQLQVDRSYRAAMPDSQLMLLAYAKWGEACPKYLVGDFAFMIWDEREHKLFGARDFSGSRTLYYHQDSEKLAFCTVIQPLLALPYIEKRLNEQWLAEFLAVTGLTDSLDCLTTPYEQIAQIPPSHCLCMTQGKVSLKRYCNVTEVKPLKLKSDEEYVEAFQEVYQQAIQARLRTHRGIGSQLSGGLDSGSVVSYAARMLESENKPLHTFSLIPAEGFNAVDYTPKALMPDERPLIQSTSEYVGGITGHYCDFGANNAYSEINGYLDMMEMPYKFFENTHWLKGMYEAASNEGVGVLLNGARGNLSISWGSALEYYALLLKRMRWIRLIQELNQYSQTMKTSRLRNVPLITKMAFPLIEKIFPSGSIPDYILPKLINENFAKQTRVFEKLGKYGFDENGWFRSNDLYYMKQRHFEDVLHWNTSNTMAAKCSLQYGVWERDPTNDLRVILFCLSIPEGQYVKEGMERALVRRATKDYLPDNVRLNVRYKGIQSADWLYRMTPHWDAFMEEAKQVTANPLMQEYLNGESLKSALSKAEACGSSPELATDPDYKILMRSVILQRFLKTFEGR